MIVRPRDNLVIAERQACYRAAMTDKCCHTPSFIPFPNFDGPIVAPRDQAQLVAGHTPNAFDMSKEGPEGFSRGNIPHLDGVVQATGYEDWPGTPVLWGNGSLAFGFALAL